MRIDKKLGPTISVLAIFACYYLIEGISALIAAGMAVRLEEQYAMQTSLAGGLALGGMSRIVVAAILWGSIKSLKARPRLSVFLWGIGLLSIGGMIIGPGEALAENLSPSQWVGAIMLFLYIAVPGKLFWEMLQTKTTINKRQKEKTASDSEGRLF